MTRERILAAGLRLAGREGLEALSMRRLARELGVDPMAIYHHVPNKRELMSGMIRAAFAGMGVPGDTGGDWRERVRAWAAAFRRVAREHPGLVPYLARYPEAAAEATLESTEELYAAFESAGMDPGMVVGAVGVVVDYANGFALAEASGALGEGEQAETVRLLDERPPGELPAMRRTLAALRDGEGAADFDLGLRIVLAGLERVMEEGGAGRDLR